MQFTKKEIKMTTQEYEAMFEEDDAPGWDAINDALEKIYDPAKRAPLSVAATCESGRR